MTKSFCCLLAVALASVPVPFSAQASASGPTLNDTVALMNKSVEAEDGYATTANDCELYFTRNRMYTVDIPTGNYLKSTDRFGIPHYGFKWMTIEESPRVVRFRLGTIDPQSIKSMPVPSAQFVKDNDVDEHPDALKQPDLMLVTFAATDSQQVIEVGHFRDGSDGTSVPVFDQKLSMELLVFGSKGRAERFVTAFVHAAQLCGGKDSAFPPTPSRP